VTRWIHGWKKNGWKTADRKPVKNEDLWRRLDAAAARHESPGTGSRATPATRRTKRADALARAGMAPFKPLPHLTPDVQAFRC
jgi:ribonuclease HI